MRRFSALVVAASIAATLTACSGGSNDCNSGVTSGEASSAVDAPGEVGTAPEVDFPTPLITNSVERSVLVHGDGETVKEGQPVILEATILSGADGTVLQQTAYAADGGSLFALGDQGLPALGTGLECATVGSRVAIVASGEEGAGSAPAAADSVVYVVDVVDAYPARATGADQLPVVGMPAVVTAPDGTPGLTIPNEEAPTDYRMAVLKLGEGDIVEEDDAVVVKITVVDWETEEVTQSTWETGGATIIDLSSDTVPAGLAQAVAGEQVGSQILAVVPPGLAGTPEAPGASTLVYVVDILGTVD